MRDKLLERDGDECPECGCKMEPGDMTIDHIIPKSKGGTDHPVNLRLLHWRCNVAKADSLPSPGLRHLIREITSKELWKRGWRKLGLSFEGSSPLRD